MKYLAPDPDEPLFEGWVTSPYIERMKEEVPNPEKWEEVPTNILMLPSMVDGKFYPYQGKVYQLKKDIEQTEKKK